MTLKGRLDRLEKVTGADGDLCGCADGDGCGRVVVVVRPGEPDPTADGERCASCGRLRPLAVLRVVYDDTPEGGDDETD